MSSVDHFQLPVAAFRRRLTARRLGRVADSLKELETHREERQLLRGIYDEEAFLQSQARATVNLDRLLKRDVPILARFVDIEVLLLWAGVTRRCIADRREIPDVEAEPRDPFEPGAVQPAFESGFIINARVKAGEWMAHLEHEIGPRPRLFIAAATEARDDVQALAATLAARFDVVPWYAGRAVSPGEHLAEALQRTARDYDFGVFFLRAEDKRQRRSRQEWVPRDNVIFELGLFMGISSLGTALALAPRGAPVHLPADLAGVIYISYESSAPDRIAEFTRVGQTVADTIGVCLERHL